VRRPRETARPRGEARPSVDAADIARLVVDMRHAHALDQQLDRLIERIVIRLQVYEVPTQR
jgi:hypothetical protein